MTVGAWGQLRIEIARTTATDSTDCTALEAP